MDNEEVARRVQPLLYPDYKEMLQGCAGYIENLLD